MPFRASHITELISCIIVKPAPPPGLTLSLRLLHNSLYPANTTLSTFGADSALSETEAIARHCDLTWSDNRARETHIDAQAEDPQSKPLIIMSNSPSKDAELDPEAQSGEEQDHMDKDHHDVQGHPGEFEVKEQDRWLPIANGMLHLAFGLF